MFVLNGKPLALDVPFEANGTLFPANWLRLASVSDREAIGITEEIDPPIWDQRFYWGYTSSGTLIPKEHGDLVPLWVDTTCQTANSLLSSTDWMVVREIDNGTPMPSGVKIWRQDVRSSCGLKVTSIEATLNTEQLATYITSPGYSTWPSSDPPLPVSVDPLSTDQPVFGATSSQVAPSDLNFSGGN